MRKVLLISLLNIWISVSVLAQCSPDPIYTSLGIPGVYPLAVQIPNAPLPLGIADGSVGFSYAQKLTLVVLEDTTMDIAALLDPTIISAINAAGISTIMSLDVNHVVYDIGDLPNALSYTCDQSNCQYSSGVDGCILISGIPAQAGTFSIPVNMTVNVQIPAITIPIVGTVIYPGSGQDLPTFPAVEYDLLIEGSTSVNDNTNDFRIFPNPTSERTTLFLENYSDVTVFNTLGEKIMYISDVNGNIEINKNQLGIGLFFINISSAETNIITKLIIK